MDGGDRPQAVFLAAAKVGGILANHTQPGPFLYDNLMIGANVMEAVRRVGVEKMVFLGSSCIYPRAAPQPISEDSLLTGPLEPTNQWYALAKIAAVKLCQAYRRQYGCDIIAVMPTNLYGAGRHFRSRVKPRYSGVADEGAPGQGRTSLLNGGLGHRTPLARIHACR